MENKINIAENLKNCPQGMELYSPIFGKVYLDKIRPHLAIVVTTDKEQGDFKEEFLYDGRYGMNGECMLFPSKDKTTWEGFVPPIEFKEGDIIYTLLESDLEFISIFKKANETLIYTYVALGSTLYRGNMSGLCKKTDIVLQRLATEEEKKKLFDAIKDSGYRWNAEKKTLEELIKPIFKKGDKVRVKNGLSEYRVIDNVEDTFYSLVPIGKIDFTDQNRWELVPNKFDINTLVPFESRVLVRHDRDNKWCGSFFSHIDEDFRSHCYKFVTVAGKSYPMCIPYEGNEHLIGKTDDCNDFYKTWE